MSKDIEVVEDKDQYLGAFAKLRPDLFFPEGWSDSQRAEAADMIRPQRTRTSMLAAIPLICRGEKCTYANTCPLLAKNLAPVGEKCPLEMAMVSQFTNDYIEELGVDPNSLTEVSMIREMVDLEVQYLRATKVLANEHFIQENIVGIDPQGKPIFRKELHLAVDFEDRIHKRRKDLRNQLLATREARAKAGQGLINSAIALSSAMETVRSIQDEKEKALKQKLGTLYKDDYVEDGEIMDDGEND
ncbi:MAG TPA: hypothetical protein VJ742_12360 [Nitrososphaera sp.]|nr:hypothetical protein [Nitrososphaera sp.]